MYKVINCQGRKREKIILKDKKREPFDFELGKAIIEIWRKYNSLFFFRMKATYFPHVHISNKINLKRFIKQTTYTRLAY